MQDNEGLRRFLSAQEDIYKTALTELEDGKKVGHWMWFIFPQIAGLGMTEVSKFYAIKDIEEATDYLMHGDLSLRLIHCCKALLKLKTNDPHEIFGSPDDLKLKSSMTLFEAVPATFPVFGQVLNKFYAGKKDQCTLKILGIKN